MVGTRALDVLRQIPFLRDVDETDIARVAEGLARREYASGQEILRQGSVPDGLYFLVQGEVEMVRQARGSQPCSATKFLPGDLLGELELLVRHPRVATVRALTPVVTYFWERRSLLAFLRRHPTALASFRLAASTRRKSFRLRLGWLEEGEVVYGLANKHPVLLYRALTLPMVLLLAAAVLGAAALGGAGSTAGWAAGVLGLVALGFGLWQWIDWANDYYIVTDRRVVWLEKVAGLYDSRQEAPLRMVLSVSVTTEAVGRALDYGDVLIRTYTGQIVFRTVGSPRAMAALVEEHWRRTQVRDQRSDRQTIVETLEQRLGEAIAPEPTVPTLPPSPERTPRDIGLDRWTFQVRFEDRGVITYRKHWAVLVRATFTPTLLILLVVGIVGASLGGLIGKIPLDSTLGIAVIALVPLILWWVYQYADWANDIYQVTSDQIVDVHKKPLAREERKVAPLENILGTEVDRKGLPGLVLNYGNVIANVGTTQFVFQGVYNPSAVQQDIVRALEACLERKKQVERDQRREEMVEWLGAYHRKISRRPLKEDGHSTNHGRS